MSPLLHPSYLSLPARDKGRRNVAAGIALGLAVASGVAAVVAAFVPAAAVVGAALAVLSLTTGWTAVLGSGAEKLTVLALTAGAVVLVVAICQVVGQGGGQESEPDTSTLLAPPRG